MVFHVQASSDWGWSIVFITFTLIVVSSLKFSNFYKHNLSPMYTKPPSLHSVKGTFHVLKGCVGAVHHRERIVSSAQSSPLPSSCAWPVSLGSFRHGGMCVWVGFCLGVCHPSGVEQLFYQQVQRVSDLNSFSSWKKVWTYFHRVDGEKLDHLALIYSIAGRNLGVIDSALYPSPYVLTAMLLITSAKEGYVFIGLSIFLLAE